jgi:hypothetical protein
MLLKCEKLSLEVEMELTGSKESSKSALWFRKGGTFFFVSANASCGTASFSESEASNHSYEVVISADALC